MVTRRLMRILVGCLTPQSCGTQLALDLTWLRRSLGLEWLWQRIREYLLAQKPWLIYNSGSFRYHYLPGGEHNAFDICEPCTNAPCPVGSRNHRAHSVATGTPAYIRRLDYWLAEAEKKFGTMGFETPPAPLHVYIKERDDLGWTDGTRIEIDHRLNHDTLAVMAIHEYFHCIQFLYVSTPDLMPGWSEGGAVASEDSFATKVNRYLYEGSRSLLRDPSVQLTHHSNAHGVALLWRYMEEQCGASVMLRICTSLRTRKKQDWYDLIDVVDEVCRRDHGMSFPTLFANFGVAMLLKDERGVDDPRFRFRENGDAIRWNGSGVGAQPSSVRKAPCTAVALAGGNGSAKGSLKNVLSHAFYSAAFGKSEHVVRVNITFTALNDSIAHVIAFRADDTVCGLMRAEMAGSYRLTASSGEISRIAIALSNVSVNAKGGKFGAYALQIDA